MERVEFNGEIPLYQQIYDILCKEIENGTYKSGQQIPSEDRLCKMFHISRVTVRNALKRMVDEKILTKRHGKGTFVRYRVFVESRFAQGSFTRSCEQMNVIPSTKVISRKWEKAEDWLADILKVSVGEDVICVKRIRKTNETPVIFETDYFTSEQAYIFEADLETVPMYENIRRYMELEVRRHIDTFEVHVADKEEAEYLLCPPYTALLGVSQIVYGDQEKVLYYNEQLISSDRYKYVSGR